MLPGNNPLVKSKLFEEDSWSSFDVPPQLLHDRDYYLVSDRSTAVFATQLPPIVPITTGLSSDWVDE